MQEEDTHKSPPRESCFVASTKSKLARGRRGRVYGNINIHGAPLKKNARHGHTARSLCVPGCRMGAHRRRIIRQRGTNSRRRGTKPADTSSSLGGDEDGSSIGSWETAETDASSGVPAVTTPKWIGGASSSRGESAVTTPPLHHPEADCSETEGFLGNLSPSHEVRTSRRGYLSQQIDH